MIGMAALRKTRENHKGRYCIAAKPWRLTPLSPLSRSRFVFGGDVRAGPPGFLRVHPQRGFSGPDLSSRSIG
jgi:hypothetical protein